MTDFHTFLQHNFSNLYNYSAKAGEVLRFMLTKPLGLLTMAVTATAPVYTTTEKTLFLLAGLFVADFITGVMASWVEFKKALPVTPGAGKRYMFSSEKMRMSGVKFVCYGMGIIVAYALESIFIIHEFEPKYMTTQKLTLTTVATLFFCVIELYSIFFENIKRMGFDIIQTVKKIVRQAWAITKEVKNESNTEEQ